MLTDTYDSIQNLTGGAGADILIGDAGNNILEGGAGADQLYGRAGANTFVYRGFADSNLIAGYDTIGDFKTGTDHIDLTAMHTDAAHVRIRTSGGSSSLYVLAGARFNSATDLAVSLAGASAVAVGDLLF